MSIIVFMKLEAYHSNEQNLIFSVIIVQVDMQICSTFKVYKWTSLSYKDNKLQCNWTRHKLANKTIIIIRS